MSAVHFNFGPDSASGTRARGTIFSKRIASSDDLDKTSLLEVRLAGSAAERSDAQALLNRMYDWRGYGDCHVIPAGEGYSTFIAGLDGDTVGTITLAVDAGTGLAADRIFRDELNMFRRMPGASLCELTKFAFDAEMPSRKLLASLFHIVFLYGMRRHRCSHLFIEVNPRHRRFYEAMLGFRPIGPLKTNENVHAPSQLMWLEVSDIAAHISEHAGRDCARNRSLYPLFLSGPDEHHVSQHLSHALGLHMLPQDAVIALQN